MTKLAKEILTKFDEYRFYLGENMNIDGLVVLQYYREDGMTPVFIYFKDGLKEEKYVSDLVADDLPTPLLLSSSKHTHTLNKQSKVRSSMVNIENMSMYFFVC